MKSFKVGDRTIGGDAPVFIIAEMSANHLGEYEKAEAIIRAAAEVGADAIKLQTYTADTMTLNCRRPEFMIDSGTVWDGKNLYDLYVEAATPWEWHKPLKDLAESLGLVFFSTPFDESSVDFLEELGVPLYKLASFEITDLALIRSIASKKKPLIFSSGIADREDINLALQTMRDAGAEELSLLKCISSYPAPAEEYNLKTLSSIESELGVIPGISDHSIGIVTPVVAVSLGAKVVEKHLCLSRELGGPDAAFSLEPHEFKAMVDAVRTAEGAIGSVSFELTDKQKRAKAFARSLFFKRDLHSGERVTADDIATIRPGNGLHPQYLDTVIEKTLTRDISFGEPLSWDQFE